MHRCLWCGATKAQAAPTCPNNQAQDDLHSFEEPNAVDAVVNMYARKLQVLIDQNADDIDDLASWIRALGETRERLQREVTLRLVRLANRPTAAKRVTVDVVVRNETKE